MTAIKTNLYFALFALLSAAASIFIPSIAESRPATANQQKSPSPAIPTASDIQNLLVAKKFAELDKRMNATQKSYERGMHSSEEVMIAFRAFYDPAPHLTPLFDEWVKKFPLSYAAHLGRGVHYKYRGKQARGDDWIKNTSDEQLKGMAHYYRLAMQDLQQAEVLVDKPVVAYMHVIDIGTYMGMHDFTHAILDKGLALEPDSMILHKKFMYGLLPRWGGSYAEMEGFLQEAKRHQVTEKGLRTLKAIIAIDRAQVNEQENDKKKALTFYNDAIALAPDNDELTKALLGRANLHIKAKRFAEAISDLSNSLNATPNDKDAYANRGFAYHNMGDLNKTFQDYKSAAELGEAWAQNQLGTFYWHGVVVPKDKNEAIKWFRLSAQNGNKEGKKNLAEALGQ